MPVQPIERASLVSIVVPIFNEVESLLPLYDEIVAAMEGWGRPFEIVLVDDGSADGSGAVIQQLVEGDERVRGVHLRCNVGQTAALLAGIDHSEGDTVVPLDADLQNDPADIPRLVAKLEEGFDVVSGWRRQRQDATLSRVWPSRIANYLISRITGVALHDYGCTLKAYRREVVEGVRLYGEMHRFVPVYAAMQGGAITELEVGHRRRQFGRSKYGLERAFKVILDLMLIRFLAGYSQKPIYVFGGVGLAALSLSAASTVLALCLKFTSRAEWQKDLVETPLPVLAAVFAISGLLAILMGVLAEMLMRTYFESQGKRTYLLASQRQLDRYRRTHGSAPARRSADGGA